MDKLPYELAKQSILTKQKSKRIGKLKKRSGEELLKFGIVVLDKPADIRSIHCGNKIKSILEVAKVGHAGTLDPMVTGVLPIMLGKAVKLSTALSKAGKVYRGLMKFHKEISEKEVRSAFKKFTGKIRQLPPRISAVKRVLRTREIYFLNLLKFENEEAEFLVGCEAGTYIRKLCHDIGEHLKVGAHMSKLVRVQSGPFKLKDTVDFKTIKANYNRYLKSKNDVYIRKIIHQPEEAVEHLPKVWIKEDVIDRLSHGSPIYAPGIIKLTNDIQKNDLVAVFSMQGELISLGTAETDSDNILEMEKGLVIKTNMVFI